MALEMAFSSGKICPPPTLRLTDTAEWTDCGVNKNLCTTLFCLTIGNESSRVQIYGLQGGVGELEFERVMVSSGWLCVCSCQYYQLKKLVW